MTVVQAVLPRDAARNLAASRRFHLSDFRWLVITVLLLARLALSVDMIGRPGVQYDETVFVHAALQINGDVLPYTFHGIPLMVYPYVGALKSWLYTPIFAVFGTSAAAIRLPVILLVCAGLLLVYLGVRDLVNRSVALVAFAVLCFDNSVFWLTRDDVGPSAIEFFMKCAALFFAARLAQRRSSRWVWLLLAVLALGVFNKLNFIWFVNAAVAISVLLAVRYRRSLRTRGRVIAIWFGGLAVLYTGFGLYYFTNHIATLGAPAGSTIGQPWGPFKSGMESILSGTWFFQYALGPTGPRPLASVIVLALFVVGAFASVSPSRHRSFAIAALALTAVVVALEAFLTPQATAGWHYVSVYPFVTVVAAYGAYAGASAILRRRTVVFLTLCSAAAVGLVYEGALMADYIRALSSREPSNAAWSPSIYRLSREIQRRPGTVFTADWGIANPLFALHPSLRYTELSFELANSTATPLATLRQSVASTPGPKLFVTHSAPKLQFAHANQSLFRAFGPHLRLVGEIAGRDGKLVFLLYRYR